MAIAVSILADTNVLLRRLQPEHSDHPLAIEAVSRLVARSETVCYTLQNIAELWNVATRPVTSNGLGLSIQSARAEVQAIERSLARLPDTPAIYDEWTRLVVQHSVHGVKAHDARLVATMNVHGVKRILTFDRGDFLRYGIDVVHPSTVPT